MSVDNVQSFGAWVAALPLEQKAGKTTTELRNQYNAVIAKGLVGEQLANKDKGTVVEPGEKGNADAQERRADAHASQVAEVAALKGESAEFVQQAVTQSGKEKPFSDNNGINAIQA